MDIRNIRALKEDALRALNRGRDPQKLVLYYSAATALLAAVLTVINYLLSREMSGLGGLSNLGTNMMLSTGQTLLPFVQTFLLLGLEFGYLYGMMRITRGQYADHTDLKMGFHKFGPILRLMLLQGLIVAGLCVALIYPIMSLYLISPWGEPLIELLTPIAASGNLVMDEATTLQAYELMIPMLVIFAIVYCAILIPIAYRFRMANYALLDDPRAGAFAALRASAKMMRRNCLNLFKLDLSLWWFYLLNALVSLLCYGDMILPMLGIELPINATLSYYLFYALYLVGLFLINYFLRNSVEATYIVAYDSIHEKPEDQGIVLGNIFEI